MLRCWIERCQKASRLMTKWSGKNGIEATPKPKNTHGQTFEVSEDIFITPTGVYIKQNTLD